jgi:hypothetical protein
MLESLITYVVQYVAARALWQSFHGLGGPVLVCVVLVLVLVAWDRRSRRRWY